MAKKELIEALAADAGVAKKAAGDMLDALASRLTQTLKDGDNKFELPGIGKLSTAGRAARTVRNPRNGEMIPVPARRAVKFTASAVLVRAVQ